MACIPMVCINLLTIVSFRIRVPTILFSMGNKSPNELKFCDVPRNFYINSKLITLGLRILNLHTTSMLGLLILKLSYCKICTYLPIFSPNSRNKDGSEKIKHHFGEKKENLPQYDSIKFLDLSHVRFKVRRWKD